MPLRTRPCKLVVRAILEHLSLWDEARPPPVTQGAAPRETVELEYLPWVE